jgi:hypothetical protein
MSINEKLEAALRKYLGSTEAQPEPPPAANAVDAVTLDHIRQAQQIMNQQKAQYRKVTDLRGELYGVSTEDWPGLIQGWLLGASDEDLATIRKSELPFKVIDFYLDKGLSLDDMQAMAKLQSPGGAATLLFEAVMMEFYPKISSAHALDMAMYGRQVYRGMLKNDPYFGPEPKKLS